MTGHPRNPPLPLNYPVGRPRLRVDVLFLFILLQIICQLALLVPALAPLRIILRVSEFAASLALAALIGRQGPFHPACVPAAFCCLVVGLNIFHPTTNTLTSGLAQATLYAANFAPLLWVPALRVDAPALRKVITLIWAFAVLSSVMGVLQVYYPGKFDPNLSSAIRSYGDWYVEDLKIVLANGERVFRPMGLTDVPGGAANGAFVAILFSAGLLVCDRRVWVKVACVGAMPVGLFCLYLCQVRVLMMMSLICVLVLIGIFLLRGQLARVALLAGLMVGVVIISLTWAIAVGGEAATRRLTSLMEDNPRTVYYSNRGRFLDETVNVLLPQYPLGAGLGRWGMMNYYFGDNSDPERAAIWAEIQWTGWLLDGGVPLILAYCAAIAAACFIALRVALDKRLGEVGVWGAIILSFNVGTFAATFNNPIFVGSQGLEFWTLNAALFAVATRRLAQARLIKSEVAVPRGIDMDETPPTVDKSKPLLSIHDGGER